MFISSSLGLAWSLAVLIRLRVAQCVEHFLLHQRTTHQVCRGFKMEHICVSSLHVVVAVEAAVRHFLWLVCVVLKTIAATCKTIKFQKCSLKSSKPVDHRSTLQSFHICTNSST